MFFYDNTTKTQIIFDYFLFGSISLFSKDNRKIDELDRYWMGFVILLQAPSEYWNEIGLRLHTLSTVWNKIKVIIYDVVDVVLEGSRKRNY